MYCRECGKEISDDAKYCPNCGAENISNDHAEPEVLTGEVLNNNESNIQSDETSESIEVTVPLKPKESVIKKVATVTGYTGIFAISWVYQIAYLVTIAVTVISILGVVISLFSSGSWFWGLVVLFIGLPLGVGITAYFFPYVAALYVISIIFWLVAKLFGSSSSFDDVHSVVIGLFWVAVFGFIGWALLNGLWEWIKSERVKRFITDNWVGIVAAICVVLLILFRNL